MRSQTWESHERGKHGSIISDIRAYSGRILEAEATQDAGTELSGWGVVRMSEG